MYFWIRHRSNKQLKKSTIYTPTNSWLEFISKIADLHVHHGPWWACKSAILCVLGRDWKALLCVLGQLKLRRMAASHSSWPHHVWVLPTSQLFLYILLSSISTFMFVVILYYKLLDSHPKKKKNTRSLIRGGGSYMKKGFGSIAHLLLTPLKRHAPLAFTLFLTV